MIGNFLKNFFYFIPKALDQNITGIKGVQVHNFFFLKLNKKMKKYMYTEVYCIPHFIITQFQWSFKNITGKMEESHFFIKQIFYVGETGGQEVKFSSQTVFANSM